MSLISESFFVKLLNYAYRPFAIRMASSVYVCVGHCMTSKSDNHQHICIHKKSYYLRKISEF